MALIDLIDFAVGPDGKLNKWQRGTPVTSSPPGAPTNVRASIDSTGVATVTWDAPLTDGGSPVTGYTVTQVGGSSQPIGPAVFTATFTGLSAAGTYTFNVVAINDAGISSSTGAQASVVVSPATVPLFPGHTQSKITSQVIFGVDEVDKDPRVAGGVDEKAAPEVLAGKPIGGMRYYYSGALGTTMAVPNGEWAASVKTQYAKGRIAFGSFNVIGSAAGVNWGTAADGRFNAVIDAMIVWGEETGPDAPMPISIDHEPNFGTAAGLTGADYGRLFRYIRSRMDIYANAHGGVGVYKWKHLSLGPVLMGIDYQTSAPATNGPIRVAWAGAAQITATSSNGTFTSNGHLLANGRRSKLTTPPPGFNATTLYWVVNATANTFQLSTTRGGAPITTAGTGTGITVTNSDVWDWCAADPYIGSGKPVPNGTIAGNFWTAAMQAVFDWCTDPAHTYPVAFTEWGVFNRDPQAGPRVKQLYNKLLDGTHDIWFMAYFNSTGGGNEIVQWILDNAPVGPNGVVNNGNLLTSFVDVIKDARSVNFWQLNRPDGARFTRPAGV